MATTSSGLAAVLLVVGQLASASPTEAQVQGVATPSYDEFMALDSEARRARLAQMRPEAIAAFKRTHAERWFAAHRSDLSPAQVAVFIEAFEFTTTDVYTRPDDPEMRKRAELLQHRLTCVLGVENTRRAFVLHLPPEPVGVGWRSTADTWLSWFFNCVAR